ncbi:HPr family phosphocarrier protein [Streptomyces sp. M19]
MRRLTEILGERHDGAHPDSPDGVDSPDGPDSAPVVERRLVVTEEAGLHARPAAAFAQAAARSEAVVTVRRVEADAREVSARSALSLMALGIRRGEEIVLRARGADAEAAIAELTAIAAPE